MPRLKGLGYGDIDLVLEKRTKDGRLASRSQNQRDPPRDLMSQSIQNHRFRSAGCNKEPRSQRTDHIVSERSRASLFHRDFIAVCPC